MVDVVVVVASVELDDVDAVVVVVDVAAPLDAEDDDEDEDDVAPVVVVAVASAAFLLFFFSFSFASAAYKTMIEFEKSANKNELSKSFIETHLAKRESSAAFSECHHRTLLDFIKYLLSEQNQTILQ